jgi:hypothetical protein
MPPVDVLARLEGDLAREFPRSARDAEKPVLELDPYLQQPARTGRPKEGRRIEQEAAGEAVPETAGRGDAGKGGECRAVGAAARHGEEALQPVPLLVRGAGRRGGGDIALSGLCRAGHPVSTRIREPRCSERS